MILLLVFSRMRTSYWLAVTSYSLAENKPEA